MDLAATFTDDQVAVMGCFAALAVCGLIGLITFHFGPQGKKSQVSERSTIRMPEKSAQEDSRKAA